MTNTQTPVSLTKSFKLNDSGERGKESNVCPVLAITQLAENCYSCFQWGCRYKKKQQKMFSVVIKGAGKSWLHTLYPS